MPYDIFFKIYLKFARVLRRLFLSVVSVTRVVFFHVNVTNLTHRESQKLRLSRAKHETFNRSLASIVYANVQDIFYLFSSNVFRSETVHLLLRIILESFKLQYFFLGQMLQAVRQSPN